MAMILTSFGSMLGQKLAPLIEEEAAILCGVKGELVKLQGKLQLIQSVLEDAERKAFHDPAVRRWTARLKDVMYDADDVIDEFRTKQLLQLVYIVHTLPSPQQTKNKEMQQQDPSEIRNLPIDIAFSRLGEWLVDRKKIPHDWRKRLAAVRSKVSSALPSVPRDLDPFLQTLDPEASRFSLFRWWCRWICRVRLETLMRSIFPSQNRQSQKPALLKLLMR